MRTMQLLLPKELGRIDGKGAAGWNPRGDKADEGHGSNGAKKNQRVARGGFVDQGRQKPAGKHTEEETGGRTCEQNNQWTAEGCAHQLGPMRPQGNANAEF